MIEEGCHKWRKQSFVNIRYHKVHVKPYNSISPVHFKSIQHLSLCNGSSSFTGGLNKTRHSKLI